MKPCSPRTRQRWAQLLGILLLGAFVQWMPNDRVSMMSSLRLTACAADPHCCSSLPDRLALHHLDRDKTRLAAHHFAFAAAFAVFGSAILVIRNLPGWFRWLIWISAMIGLLWRLNDGSANAFFDSFLSTLGDQNRAMRSAPTDAIGFWKTTDRPRCAKPG